MPRILSNQITNRVFISTLFILGKSCLSIFNAMPGTGKGGKGKWVCGRVEKSESNRAMPEARVTQREQEKKESRKINSKL